MGRNFCPSARKGGTCEDTSCSKNHDFVRCEPCDLYLPTFSLEEHLTGRRHLRNVASKGASNLGPPHQVQQVPPSQSASSNPRCTPHANTSQLPGGKEPNTTLQKQHDFVRCEPCNLYLPTFSLEEHQTGSRHLRNATSKGASDPGPPHRVQQVSPSQSASSKLRSTPQANTSQLSGGKEHNPGADLPIARSNKSGSRTNKVAYCATTLQGDTCVDSRCQYRHDTVRCEPCGRSFPASMSDQHRSGRFHLQNVTSNGFTDPNTSQHPGLSRPGSPTIEPSPLKNISPPSTRTSSPSILAVDLPVTVSHEDGLDFVAEEMAADHSFPSISRTISIENTSLSSDVSVKSMKLTPSMSPCFSASLLGKTAMIRQGTPRMIRVVFNAPHPDTFLAVLRITFSDKTRPSDQEWIVTRVLRGRAILPACDEPAGPGELPAGDIIETMGHDEDDGIAIAAFPYFALEFSVKYQQSNGSFTTQTKDLIITKTSAVSFTAARVHSPDASMAESFSAQLVGDSTIIKPKEWRVVAISFTPRQGGLCEAVLDLTFHDHKRKADFVIKRTLTGWANRPPGARGHHQKKSTPNPGCQSINDGVNDHHTEILVDEEEDFLDSDGTGISVSHEGGLYFGIVERKRSNGPFATPSSLLAIELAAGFPGVTFMKKKTRMLNGSDPEFEAVFEGDSNIRSGTQSAVRVIFSPKFEGAFEAMLELVFYHSQLSASFAVQRMLHGIAGSLEDHKHIESLGRGGDDEPTGSSRNVPSLRVILLFPPDQRQRSGYLPEYEVPSIIQEAVDNSIAKRPYDEKAPDLISTLRPDRLAMTSTYVHYLEALLCVEDGHQQWDVLCQPPYTVDVQERSQWYDVEIENDDEDLLPEVALADFLWLDDVRNNIRYEASVTDIDVFMRRDLAVLRMSLRLPTAFSLNQDTQFVLRFRHNRITLRRQYHALTTSFPPSRRLLFPSLSDIKPKRHLSRADVYDLKFRHLVNRRIRDDPQQLQAVVSILEQTKGSVPFIVYGPPGTGKTSTIVESIVQLVRRDASVRVLACTPSDAAADYLEGRLAATGLDSDKLYRLAASLASEDDVSEDDAPTFSQISWHERLLSFRVVLSTCSSAGTLQNLNVPIGHFSHIVVDEAAQAEEPLVMIPILTFSNAFTNIILAGDANQLGPTVKSPIAAKSGLGKSYFQRLMFMSDVYGLDAQTGTTIVALQRNWRSHGAIIAWSNRYLYADVMRDYGNAYITYHLVDSGALPKKGFPVAFHGIKGSEQRAKWSLSYSNVLDASIVRDYCVKLIGDPDRKIYPEEIGVLASYKAHARAIRQLLKVANLSDVSVGSVEQFQGQERKVMILATTRGGEETHPRRPLGLLTNRQRMNVAITRAQALLIVIGDPEVLGKYEHWRTFLKYVKSRKGWTGKMHDCQWEHEEVDSPSGYEVVPRAGGVVYGDEFIGGKSEKIYRTLENSEELRRRQFQGAPWSLHRSIFKAA